MAEKLDPRPDDVEQAEGDRQIVEQPLADQQDSSEHPEGEEQREQDELPPRGEALEG